MAGGMFHTIRNLRAGQPPESGIKDCDIFYFDANDSSEAAEHRDQARMNGVLADLAVTVELANEPRVHSW